MENNNEERPEGYSEMRSSVLSEFDRKLLELKERVPQMSMSEIEEMSGEILELTEAIEEELKKADEERRRAEAVKRYTALRDRMGAEAFTQAVREVHKMLKKDRD